MSTVAGFPYAKLDAAKLLLYSYKPWWRNFGDRMDFVPIDTPTYDDSPYTGSIKARQDMKLLIDKSFVMNSSVSIIAGKIEYELQKYIISYWDRLNQVVEKDRERVRQACLGMEVTSSMVSDSMFLPSPNGVPGLSGSFIRKWNITEPPTIPDSVWSPQTLGLPMGLSAEDYYERTKGYFEMPDVPQNGDGPGDSGDSDDSQQDEQSQDGESTQGSDTTDGDVSEDKDAQDVESGDDSDAPFGDITQDDTEEDQDQSDSGDAENNDSDNNPNDETSDDKSSDQPDDNPDDDSEQSAESDSDDSEVPDSTREREWESNRSDRANMDDLDPSSEQDDEISDDEPEIRENEESSSEQRHSDKSFDVDEGYQQSALSSDTIADKINEESRQDPALDWETRDDDSIDQDVPQDDKQEELQEALDDLADSIDEAEHAGGFDVMRPGNSILHFPQSVKEARRDKVLRKVGHVLSRAINTQMTKGYNDFSYSVRNPNQPQFGPIMMGTNDYNPEFYWLQDVSMSMHTLISTCYDKLKETTKDLSVKYGDALTWITADTKIEQVGKSYNLPDDPRDTITKGFGATDISAAILELVTGKFKFEGKRYQRPDVLFVTTDCFFNWDPALERLSNKVKIIILCPLELDYVKSIKELPDWIVEGKTFFHVGV